MRSGKLTNILLLLVFIALAANVLVPMFRAKDAVAVVGADSIPPSVAAEAVARENAPYRLSAEVAAALKDIAAADQEIAAAILEHSRSNQDIAYALERVASEMRSQSK